MLAHAHVCCAPFPVALCAQLAVLDPQDSCEVVVRLAATCPERFHMAASGLVKPLIATSKHQHSRVRVAAVKAIGSAVQHGPSDLLEEVRTIMAQRTMDDSPSVRKALYGVATNWLLHHKDRCAIRKNVLSCRALRDRDHSLPGLGASCSTPPHWATVDVTAAGGSKPRWHAGSTIAAAGGQPL